MSGRGARGAGGFGKRTRRWHLAAAPILAVLAAVVASAPSQAQLSTQEEPVESFEIGLSTNRIGITADFNGAQLVVFGALDNADARIQRQQRYDIVVALFGPRAPVVVREKQPVLGIWINQDSETFDAAPITYSVASTRPFQDIASKAVRERLSLGIDSVRLSIADQDDTRTTPRPAKPIAASSRRPCGGSGPIRGFIRRRPARCAFSDRASFAPICAFRPTFRSAFTPRAPSCFARAFSSARAANS